MTIGKFLAHYGIKGQKWGVRRDRGPGGTVSSGAKKGLSGVDDAELMRAVQRMRLEREFKQLSSERQVKGQSFVKSTLKDIGKKQVRRVAGTAADIAVEQALKNLGVKTGNPHLGEIATRIGPKVKKDKDGNDPVSQIVKATTGKKKKK